MNDDPCVVTVNNTDYYIACNSLEYVVKDNNRLINTSNSSITMYHDYPVLNDNTSGYPRISASANQVFYYRSSYSAQNTQLSVNQYEIVNRHTSNDILLSIVIIVCLVMNLFKR